MPPSVSVIIPCRNEEKTIHLVLDAIYGQSYPHELLQVVIADGFSEDSTREKIADFKTAHPELDLLVVDNPQRIIPAGLNAAIRASSGDIIVRMDAHSIPNPDYVARCVDALERNIAQNVGGVWDIRPGKNTWVARSIAAAAGNPLAVGDARYRFTDKADYVDTVPYGSYKRDLFEQIGLFDETLLANEDYELNTRILQSGGKIWLDPNIRCTYFARSNLRALAKQYYGYGYWKVQMLKRYPETLRWRQALPPAFLLGLLLTLLVGIFWKPSLYLFALVLGLYLLILLSVGTHIAIKKRDILMMIGVPLAIITMHFAWGAGFMAGAFGAQKKP
jgi:glycosyltransferase involved in cell wall biosynthesis